MSGPRTPLILTVISSICIGSLLASTAAQSEYRLPDNHIPREYDLRLTVDPEVDEFTGELVIEFSTTNATNTILLHASPTKITRITRILLDLVHSCDYSYPNESTEILNVTCKNVVEASDYHKLVINYKGVFEKENYLGLYKGSYETDEDTRFYAVTQFETTYARTAFPCFDEPRFKAEFQLSITYPTNYTVLSNTEVIEQSVNARTGFTKFKKSPKMSTYLVAVVVAKFVNTTSNEKSMPSVNIYSRGNQRSHTGTAVQYSKQLVDSLGEWTGISYQDLGISKVDLVAVPEFVFGAMENWGLITFQEADLLDEGDDTSAEDKQNIVATIAHELAHHWFGDYVTLDWWSDAWLNEGFATYFQYHIPAKEYNLELQRQFVPLALQTALKSDGPGAYPLSSPEEKINTPTDTINKFDTISYNKGASVIRMIRTILGEDKFKQGLQLYLKLNALQNATPKKLLDTLGASYENKNVNFTDYMSNWIYQSGYPVVTVAVDTAKDTVAISQQEFQPSQLKKDVKPKLWNIPITFGTRKNSNNTILWLTNEKPLKIGIDADSWIILNLEQTGYYRVNYDKELWRRIIAALKSDDMSKMHVSNRAQLIDDAFALAKAGQLNYGTVLDLASYLSTETEFEPWYAAAQSLKYISRVLEMHGDQKAVANLKTIVLDWITSASGKIAKIPKTHLLVLTNQVLFDLKCQMGDSSCLEASEKIFNSYKQTKHVDDHNTRKTAFCFGLKTSKSPEEDYNKLIASYVKSDSAIERKTILYSLGCITNKNVLKKYLSQMLNNTSIDRTDEIYVYRSIIYNNQPGIEVVLEFLIENLTDIVKRYNGLIGLSELLMKPAEWVVSKEQSDKLLAILEKYRDIQGMAGLSSSVKEELANNRRWFEKYQKDIEDAIDNLMNNTSVTVPSITLLILSLIIFWKI